MLELISNFLFPKQCGGCGGAGSLLCDLCFTKLPGLNSPLCPGCFRPIAGFQTHRDCRRFNNPNFLFIPFRHKGVMINLIKTAKYSPDKRLAVILARILIEEIEGIVPLCNFLRLENPLIVPAPPSTHIPKRGVNLASILAKQITINWRLSLPKKGITKAVLVTDMVTSRKTTRKHITTLRKKGINMVWLVVLAH